jgi:hypothetical protein
MRTEYGQGEDWTLSSRSGRHVVSSPYDHNGKPSPAHPLFHKSQFNRLQGTRRKCDAFKVGGVASCTAGSNPQGNTRRINIYKPLLASRYDCARQILIEGPQIRSDRRKFVISRPWMLIESQRCLDASDR